MKEIDWQGQKIPFNLYLAIKDIYTQAGLKMTTLPLLETESLEYGACRFSLNGKNIIYRQAKTTPTKLGQFVTLWKRKTPKAPIQPFDANDLVDFVIIGVDSDDNHGQFILNRETLLKKGIFKSETKRGKLSFRVYPPWTQPHAPQAIQTQTWQLKNYLPLLSKKLEDITLLQNLIS